MPRLIMLLVCSLFAIKALVLIDATGLWSDELYSVGKSFQPSLTTTFESGPLPRCLCRLNFSFEEADSPQFGKRLLSCELPSGIAER